MPSWNSAPSHSIQAPPGMRSRRMSDSDLSELIYSSAVDDSRTSRHRQRRHHQHQQQPMRKCLSAADHVGVESLKRNHPNAIDLDATDIEQGTRG